MPFDAPFLLGPFSVDALGRLAPRGPDSLPGFHFRWRGRIVRARLSRDTPVQDRLVLQATLGRVPSSARQPSSGLREQSFRMLRLLRRTLPSRWELLLLPDHRVLLDAGSHLAAPVTATGLLVELTRFLLELAPYLDVLDEAGIGGVPAAPGSESICPG